MPDIKTDDGCIIHVEVEGPQNAPVLMLSNSLGTNLHMWDDQAPAWSRQFRLVRYDWRGHGQSSVRKGPYPMERLGRDVLAVIDALGIAKISWCGLSMGGMVGQWLGANAPPASTNLYCPTPHPISPTKRCGRAGSRPCAKKVWPRSSVPIWSAGSPRNSATAIRKRWRGCARCSWPPNLRVISAAAKASATWITARCSQRSAHPHS